MEAVMRDLVRLMAGLRRRSGADRDLAHAEAREEMAQLVEGTRELAMQVNFTGPAALLERMVPKLPKGGSVTFYSSLWATHFPHPQVPVYYEVVAEAKQALEHWMEKQAKAWKVRQITTAVISANLIIGTRMGYLLDRFCTDLMPPAERERWRSTYVSCDDLVGTTIDVLAGAGPDTAGGFVRRFLPVPGQVLDHMSPDDSPMEQPVALAHNAPRWGADGQT
jgi:NAD(P)-dependent dehydrogenase (short-subunit alcohol dehydrogenase family)